MLNVFAGVGVLRGCCVEVVESAAGMVTALGGGGASMQRYFYYFIIILLYCDIIENKLHWVIQIDYRFLVKNQIQYVFILGTISIAQDQLHSKDQLSSNTYKDGMKQTVFIMKQKEKKKKRGMGYSQLIGSSIAEDITSSSGFRHKTFKEKREK